MNVLRILRHRIPAQKSCHSLPLARCLSTDVQQKPLQTGGFAAHLSFSGEKKFPIVDPNGMTTLIKTLENLAMDDGLRVLFMRSTIAGADLNYMKNINSPAGARKFIEDIDSLCRTIQDFRVPIVAVCDGPCLGAGMEVAAACDLRIATKGTMFGMPETRVVCY